MKIAINRSRGGFSVSQDVQKILGVPISTYGYLDNEKLGIDSPHSRRYRADKRLIAAIEASDQPNGRFADIKIVEVPDDVDWVILQNDGMEWVAEKHRTWE